MASLSTPNSYDTKASVPASPRHKRSSLTLVSTSCGLVRSISRDIQTGWNTPTTEKASSANDVQCKTNTPYKPRHARRDCLKLCIPCKTHDDVPTPVSSPSPKREFLSPSPTSRQDSFHNQPQDSVGDKKTAQLGEDGLVPNRNLDIWSQGWEAAFERRASIVSGGNQSRRGSDASSLTGRLVVTEEDIKQWTFSGSRKASLRPELRSRKSSKSEDEATSRRPSDVPSLVLSYMSSRTELEDLEEESEGEGEGKKEVLVETVETAEAKRWGKVLTPEVVVLGEDGLVV